MSSRCINSRGRINPSEFPIRFTSIFMDGPVMYYEPYNITIVAVQQMFYSTKALLPQAFQLANQPVNHTQSALPERRIAGVETERREQFGVVLGTAGGEHREIALSEAF